MAAPLELSVVDAAMELIKQVGFPIFVACWFMLRTDQRLDALIRKIDKLHGGDE